MAIALSQSMRVALPTWNDRVSPVFDVAREALVVDIEDDGTVRRDEVRLNGLSCAARAKQLADLGVDVVICGAISRDLDEAVSLAGIDVIPQTRGRADRVLRAFISGQLTAQAFLMPGCDGHRRHVPHGRRSSVARRPGTSERPQ